MLKFVTLIDYGSVSLTTSTQVQSDKIPRVLGSIVGLRIQAVTTGTGTPDAPITNIGGINDLKVTDVNRNQIFDIQGLDIPYLAYNNSPFGVFVAGSAFAVASATSTYFLTWPIKVSDQPLTVSMTLDTLAVISGGATTSVAHVDITIDVAYDDASDPAASLRMVRNDTVTAASGTTDLSNRLGQNLNTVHLALNNVSEQDDVDVTNITFEANSQVQIETMVPNQFVSWEAVRTVSGHQGGYFPIPLNTSFVANATSKLTVTTNEALTFRLYQFYVA